MSPFSSLPCPQKTPNPRRTPPHLSVSLVHGQPLPSPHSQPSRLHAVRPSSRSKPSGGKQPAARRSQGNGNGIDQLEADRSMPRYDKKRSPGESSNADSWFETSNNNVAAANSAVMDVDEPPFYLRSSSSSSSLPEVDQHQAWRQRQQQQSYFGSRCHGNAAAQRLYRNRQARDYSDSSSSSSDEDFRGVIDDLTIENQKLKRKLKKYQSLHDTHLQADKLFEVRVHGLPVEKKRELEELMKKFALSLNSPSVDSGTLATQAASDSAAQARLRPNVFSHPASSATSRIADSAYASMSGSGQSGTASRARKQSDQLARQSNSNLQSYLQEIPEGLLPKERIPMSDRARKKMVVKRLEQVFAGKGRTDRGYQQPQQQEEVAQSAASADRRAKRESGRRVQAEGSREARIMPVEDASRTWPRPSDAGTLARQHSNSGSEGAAEKSRTKGSDSEGLSPGQRPTRPLDLDPYRAQIPDDNLEYMRHLGFSPTDVHSGEAPEQGHGWIYLNLLMNMAQLHTINVTQELVKKAIFGFSTKLELSRDGRKVRWKGGRDLTKPNSGNSTPMYRTGNVASLTKGELSDSLGRSKRQKTMHDGADGDLEQGTGTMNLKKTTFGRAKHPSWYSPVLYRHERSDESDQSEEGHARFNTDQNTVLAEPLHPATSEPPFRSMMFKRCQNDGPIIFYSNARFCTDLSGDSNGRQLVPCNYADVTSIAYKPILGRPIGDAPVPASSDDGSDDSFRARRSGIHAKGPLSINDSAQLLDAMALDDRERNGNAGADGSDASPKTGSVDIDFLPDSFSLSQEYKDAYKGTRDDGAAMDIDIEVPRGRSGKDEGFAVSGLGGVHPDDNFAIDVECRLVRTDVGPDGGDEKEAAAVHRIYDHDTSRGRYCPRIREALRKTEVSVPATTNITDFAMPSASSKDSSLTVQHASLTHRSQPLFKEIIVSARLNDLPTSVLPPPVFLSYPSMSDDATGVLDEDGSGEEVDVDVKSPSDVMSTSGSSREQERDEDIRSDVRMYCPSTADENSSEGGPDVSDDENGDDGEDLTHTDAAKGFAMRKGEMLSYDAAASTRKADDGASFHSSSSLSSAGASSSSVDFLAEARELDPEFVREREREYAAHMADRLAEEIPVGSSAATAGGGSGYNSSEDEKLGNASGGDTGSDGCGGGVGGGSSGTESE